MRFLFPVLVMVLATASLSALELTIEVPDAATPAERAAVGKIVSVMLTEERRIAEVLGATPASRAAPVRLVFKSMPGVAHALGRELTFSLEHLQKHPDDAAGVGVHELTHVIQGYGANYRGANVWITEGMADYVRFGLFEGGRYGFTHDAKTQNYDSSYRVTGRFLGWCEARKPGLVKALHAALSSGGEGVPVWERHSGATLPELWRVYCAAQAAPSAAARDSR